MVKLKTGAKIVAGMGAGEPTVGRMGEVVGDTVHFDIVDQAGNMVSSTPSGGWLQSSPVIPELGFLPRHPRCRCSGWRKAIRPRSRPASGRAPRSRRRWRCATASRTWPGARPAATSRTSGSRSSSCGTSTAGMNLQEAIDAPAWHSEHFPISFWPRTARPGVLVVEGRAAEGDA